MLMIRITKITHFGFYFSIKIAYNKEINYHILTFEYPASFLEYLNDLQYDFYVGYRNNIQGFSFYEDLSR